MLTTASREIGGKTYHITSLAAHPGRGMLIKLFKLIGPTLAQALRGKNSLAEIKLAQMSGDDLANMVLELSERVSEEEFNTIVETFLDSTQVHEKGGKGPVPIEKYLAFSGDYGTMFKWLAFCIEHNYSSFLGDLGLTANRT